jgi:hypothetical protein
MLHLTWGDATMFRKSLTITVLLAVLAVGWTDTAEARRRLDAGTIRAGLRTANPNQETWIAYVVALRDHGQLPDSMLESSFHWARRKLYHIGSLKFEYFKHALITQAAKIGITLPKGTPALEPAINGRVVLRVLLIDIPCPNCTVTLQEDNTIGAARRKSVTDQKGQFTFSNVPYGRYTLTAKGTVLLLTRSGTAAVTLPTPPPSSDSVFVEIRVK